MINYCHRVIPLLYMCCRLLFAQQPVTDLAKLNTIAEKWTSIIIKQSGHWNSTQAVVVEQAKELKQDHCLLGYLCVVRPSGFIFLSPYEELCPIKAYSTTSNYKEETGISDFLKTEMQRLIPELLKTANSAARLNKGVGTESSPTRCEWSMLANGTMAEPWQNRTNQAANYGPGEALLQTAWDQCYPYNNRCPLSCSGAPGAHAYAGCVAVAAAQIMRFWHWPPYRNNIDAKTAYYDWPSMMDWCKFDFGLNKWLDEAGKPLTSASIDQVARLCLEAGVSASTRYGCDKSQAWIADQPGKDMLDGLRDEFFYHDNMTFKRHNVIEPVDWFNLIKKEINENRPVLYAVQNAVLGAHCMVIDGWQEIGPTPIRMYHVNLGMGPYDGNTWYAIEEVPISRYYDTETMVIGIKPAHSLGAKLAGQYDEGAFAYRYVDQNAVGEKASFAAGQNIQFLAGMHVGCKGSIGAAVTWAGRPDAQTLLFSKGNRHKGIRLVNGKLVVRNRGLIRFVR